MTEPAAVPVVPESVRVREIRAIIAPWLPILAGVAGLVLAGAALEMAPPFLLRRIVDAHLAVRRPEGLFPLAVLYLAVTAAAALTGFLVDYLTATAAQSALRDLRVRLFGHLQRLPMRWFDRTPLGDIISRCTADVDTIDTLFSSGIVSVISDLFRLLSISAAMVLLSPFLTLVATVVIPPVYFVTRAFRTRVRDAERDTRKATGMVNVRLQENLGAVEVIRAFGRERAFAARFVGELKTMLRAFNRSNLFSTFYSPMMAQLSACAAAILLYAGASGAVSGRGISVGTLTAFVLLFQRFFRPIIALGDDWQTVQSALAGIERIRQVLAEPADEVRPAMRQVPGPGSGGPAVEVRDVVFGYFPGQPVLRGVSLTVRAGEHVAVVGRTGSGKSTLLSLVGGLYGPGSGTILVNGRDPRELAENDRRRIAGVVPQTVNLFSGSVLENLTLGDLDVSQDAVRRAAGITGAETFIRALPRGYETLLGGAGRGGLQLSSGQRQLLALTRALVFDPPLLVLDEATSSVDGESDAAFRAALEPGIAAGRAVLTVAHRLASACAADRVVVLEAGAVVEEGPPAELTARGGRFAAFLELESAGWDWRTG
jgi:ATP-binding cassette subfamily B protein